MMRKLGQLSSAAVLGCLLCLALFSTGAFAQSAGYTTANNAAQSVTAHVWQGVVRGQQANGGWRNRRGWYGGQRGWYGGRTGWGRRGWYGGRSGWYGNRFNSGSFTRFIRVTRMIRVTQIIRVTQVRLIRVTRFIRETQLQRVSSCGGGC